MALPVIAALELGPTVTPAEAADVAELLRRIVEALEGRTPLEKRLARDLIAVAGELQARAAGEPIGSGGFVRTPLVRGALA